MLFQDPAIQQATQNSAKAEKNLEDYNPFDNNPQNVRPTTVPISTDDFDPVKHIQSFLNYRGLVILTTTSS